MTNDTSLSSMLSTCFMRDHLVTGLRVGVVVNATAVGVQSVTCRETTASVRLLCIAIFGNLWISRNRRSIRSLHDGLSRFTMSCPRESESNGVIISHDTETNYRYLKNICFLLLFSSFFFYGDVSQNCFGAIELYLISDKNILFTQ